MHISRLVWLTLFLPVIFSQALHAQTKPVTMTIGGGVLFADNGEEDLQSSRGATGFLRVHWRNAPVMLEASVQHMPRNSDIVFTTSCPPAPAPCVSPFIGPTTAITFAPALQFAERQTRPSGVSVLVRVGPSLSWHVSRQDGSEPLAVGARAGMSVRLGTDGVIVSADAFRLFNSDGSPGWYLPITLGVEF